MHDSEHNAEVHVASVRLLVVIWVLLLIGTWATVSVTYLS